MKVNNLKNKKEIIVLLFLILCSIIPISPVLGINNKAPINQELVLNEEESESIISNLEGPDYLQRPQHYQTLSKLIGKTERSNKQRGPPPVSVSGTRQLLVILVEFSDVAPNAAHTVAHFNDRFFGNNAPSVRHFFNENSYNQFTYVPGGVMGWYTSSYSQNQWTNVDERDVATEAIEDVDVDFNFAPYDVDNNGVVTNEELTIFIIVSGNGGGAFHWFTRSTVSTADGVDVEGEFSATHENRHIGSYCHELGHDLGLPDLYDTNGGSNGIGRYGLMGGGSWTFSHMTAWSKIQLGWITPTIVRRSGYYYVDDAESNAEAFILADSTYSTTEYFLVENRRPTNSFYETTGPPIAPSGTYPDEGIVIYHIDETKMQDWINHGTNNVNHDEAHKGVDVECADSPTSHVINADDLDTGTNRGDTDDLWDNGEYTFHDKSTPCNAQWYGGINSGISIRFYSTPGDNMKVFFTVPENGDMNTGNDAFNSYSASDDATVISSSISGTGNIDYSTDEYDHYKFNVRYDTYTTIEFRPPPGVEGLDFIVYGPDKKVLIEKFDVKSRITERIYSKSGYIYITVDGDVEDDSGTYYLKLGNYKTYNDMRTKKDAFDAYLASDSATLLKSPISGIGFIEDYSTDEYDQYKVAVKSGDQVSISFKSPIDAETMDLALYHPNKSLIKVINNIKSEIKEIVTAKDDGYIYITVDADSNKDKGKYYLSIGNSADNDLNTGVEVYDSYGVSDDATEVNLNNRGYGSLNYYKDEYDHYKIAVESGDKVSIYFDSPRSSETIDLAIYHANKSLFKVVNNIASYAYETIEASEDGFIYFTVDADSHNDTGVYYINLYSTAGNDMKSGGDGDDNYFASDSATLLQTPITARGELKGSQDQYDQYKVAVESGDEITIRITPPSGATLFDLLIYDFDKTKIKEVSDFNTTKTITVTASGDGYIYFVLDADSSNDYGEYFLSVCSSGENDLGSGKDACDAFSPSNDAESIRNGHGYITYEIDMWDQYKISVKQGDQFNIYFESPERSTSVDLVIFGSNSRVIKRYYDIKSKVYSSEEVLEDDTFYITVCAHDERDTGRYLLFAYTTN